MLLLLCVHAQLNIAFFPIYAQKIGKMLVVLGYRIIPPLAMWKNQVNKLNVMSCKKAN